MSYREKRRFFQLISLYPCLYDRNDENRFKNTFKYNIMREIRQDLIRELPRTRCSQGSDFFLYFSTFNRDMTKNC